MRVQASDNSELPLFLHWEKFLMWLLPKTAKFPKSVRFTLQQRIDNHALDVLEAILAARYQKNRTGFLQNASVQIDKLQETSGSFTVGPWPGSSGSPWL